MNERLKVLDTAPSFETSFRALSIEDQMTVDMDLYIATGAPWIDCAIFNAQLISQDITTEIMEKIGRYLEMKKSRQADAETLNAEIKGIGELIIKSVS